MLWRPRTNDSTSNQRIRQLRPTGKYDRNKLYESRRKSGKCITTEETVIKACEENQYLDVKNTNNGRYQEDIKER